MVMNNMKEEYKARAENLLKGKKGGLVEIIRLFLIHL